jgi:hypothetical protein
MNVEIKTETAPRAIPRKGIHKWDFRGNVLGVTTRTTESWLRTIPLGHPHINKKRHYTIRVLYKTLVLLYSRQFEEKIAEPEAHVYLPAFEGVLTTIKSFSALAW